MNNDESHLATIFEIDSPFVEQCPTSSRVSVSVIAVSMKNAGCLGTGSYRLSFVSIITTFDMGGLSIGLAWTQSNPTWLHLITSFLGVDSLDNTASFPQLPCLRQIQHVKYEISLFYSVIMPGRIQNNVKLTDWKFKVLKFE